MKLSTAFKVTGLCLVALIAEAILAYLIFSNYAFSLTESGEYTAAEAYSSGPMGKVARSFYLIFGFTIAVGIAAPIISLVLMMVRHRPENN